MPSDSPYAPQGDHEAAEVLRLIRERIDTLPESDREEVKATGRKIVDILRASKPFAGRIAIALIGAEFSAAASRG